jgi:hypothetical protein
MFILGLEVLTALLMKIPQSSGICTASTGKRFLMFPRRIGPLSSGFLDFLALNKKLLGSSKKSISIRQSTWRHIEDGFTLQSSLFLTL